MSIAQDPLAPITVPSEPDEARLARSQRIRLLLRSPTFLIGCALVGWWVVCAFLGHQIAPQNPQAPDVLDKLASPSGEHPLGTDRLGRDVLSRVIVGARSVLIIAPLATLLGTVLGAAIGLLTGYFRGLVDDVFMRIVDAFLALPVIIIALVAIAAVGPGQGTLILVIGFIFTLIIAKTVRAAVLGAAQLEYVQAARLRNERAPYVMFAEILPNVMGPVLVEFTVRLGYAIFTVATLSFLGFGIQPPAPDWGVQVFEHYGLISGGYWWPVLFPALTIAILVVAVNLIADGITHVLER
jgi:peptide/nickel transport system permease protein